GAGVAPPPVTARVAWLCGRLDQPFPSRAEGRGGTAVDSKPSWFENGTRKRSKGPVVGALRSRMSRQRPTLPPRYQGSTIGAGGLNFRVRNGTGCLPSAMAAETVGLVATAPGLLDRNPGRPRERR